MLLYRPTLDEINPILDHGAAKWPALASRIQQARQILMDGFSIVALDWDKLFLVRWEIPSQTNPGRSYYLMGSNHCSCKDRPPVTGQGRCFCKHAIAIHAYRRILRNHLNADIESGIVQIEEVRNDIYAIHAHRMGMVAAYRYSPTVLTFQSDDSLVFYSMFLVKRSHPIAIPAQPNRITAQTIIA